MGVDVILIQFFGLIVDVRSSCDHPLGRTLLGNRGLGAWPHFEEHPGNEFKTRILEALSGFIVDRHPSQNLHQV